MTPSSQEITRWLVARSQGDKAALDHLLPLIYTELHRMAQRYMGGENPGQHVANHRAHPRSLPSV